MAMFRDHCLNNQVRGMNNARSNSAEGLILHRLEFGKTPDAVGCDGSRV
jgi:hypothetical protein